MTEISHKISVNLNSRGGVLLRGHDGAALLESAVEFLAESFGLPFESAGKTLEELEKFNLDQLRIHFSARGENGPNFPPEGRRRRPGGELSARAEEQFAFEILKEPAYFSIRQDADEKALSSLARIASLLPEKAFYAILVDADFARDSLFAMALENRGLSLYSRHSGHIMIPENLKFICVTHEYFPNSKILRIFPSLVIPINAEMADERLFDLMNAANELLESEISDEEVRIGEHYFKNFISIEQTLSDIEVVLFNIIPRRSIAADGSAKTRKEIIRSILSELEKRFLS